MQSEAMHQKKKCPRETLQVYDTTKKKKHSFTEAQERKHQHLKEEETLFITSDVMRRNMCLKKVKMDKDN